MNRTMRFDTREHILATGEQLCVQRGFNGLGLIALLKEAGVPKGSFYHYFASKEAFGVAMLERYFARYHLQLKQYLEAHQGNSRQRLLDYYQQSLNNPGNECAFAGCLSVKLSAEVCDLSEDMREALQAGSAAVIATLRDALQSAQRQGHLAPSLDCPVTAQTLYMLWLGASLQSKICRDSGPLHNALREMQRIMQTV